MSKQLTLAALLAASVAMSAPAHAVLLNFDVTGSRTASFQLDSNPTPSSSTSNAFGTQIRFNDVSGIFNNVTEDAGSVRFGTGSVAAFQIFGTTSFGFAPFTGSSIFTGPRTAPVFQTGVFNLTSSSAGNITLTISQAAAAIPEPATWAMMIAGFGLVGAAARRRTLRHAIA